jgi:hypothetical protein
MSDKKIKRIMFYDEKQKAWLVDTMEIDENEQQEKGNQAMAGEKESEGGGLYV